MINLLPAIRDPEWTGFIFGKFVDKRCLFSRPDIARFLKQVDTQCFFAKKAEKSSPPLCPAVTKPLEILFPPVTPKPIFRTVRPGESFR
jgi:hypothetical protein